MGRYKWTPHRQDTLVCGVGYCDIKGYVAGLLATRYKTWASMLSRCYSEREQARFPTYIGCSVDPRWHIASVFKKWFDRHYVEGYHLDKDILVPGNKVYGPDTCCFVPGEINLLILKKKKTSGSPYPAGINWCKRDKRLSVHLSIRSRAKHLGSFKKEELQQAIACYNEAKRDHIIEIAREYYADGRITAKVKNALIKRAKAFIF